ncbi:MAG: DUF721 domain-containing protein [Fimbriimonadaceae bacterium]|nr:DUF721 domain-containing protein [Fimbriimonadaceae bacterium]
MSDRSGQAAESFRSGGGPTAAGRLLRTAIGRHGGTELAARLELQGHWAAVVGEAIARQTEPTRLQDGVLTIAVVSPSWHGTLRSMERKLLATIQDRCPHLRVATLRFQLGRPAAAPARASDPDELTPAPGEVAGVVLSPAVLVEVDALLQPLTDERLRAVVRAALISHRQLQQWRLQHGWRRDPADGELLPPPSLRR